MKYKAIIFDFDGVLNDTESIKFSIWKKVIGKPLSKQEYIKKYCGRSAEFIAAAYRKEINLKQSVEEIVAKNKEVSKIILLKDIRPIKRNIEFLKKCYKIENLKIGLASSQERSILVPSLKRLNIQKYFTRILAGHEIKRMKPAPDIYLAICKKLGVKPKEAIVIEDSQAGVESAAAAGIGLIVAIPREFTKLQDFSRSHIVIGMNIRAKKGQLKLSGVDKLLKML
ncbi:HAD family phosphatase [Candidatus Woesearchaeota archaeon]|nr:HAD family phosphatase [Candidatus Woesearchaeota archaeon]